MSATAPTQYGYSRLTPPDGIPSNQRRAEGDLRYSVQQRQGQIDALKAQLPALRREDNQSSIASLEDLIAVHKEVIDQLEAGIAWGRARASEAHEKKSAPAVSEKPVQAQGGRR